MCLCEESETLDNATVDYGESWPRTVSVTRHICISQHPDSGTGPVPYADGSNSRSTGEQRSGAIEIRVVYVHQSLILVPSAQRKWRTRCCLSNTSGRKEALEGRG